MGYDKSRLYLLSHLINGNYLELWHRSEQWRTTGGRTRNNLHTSLGACHGARHVTLRCRLGGLMVAHAAPSAASSTSFLLGLNARYFSHLGTQMTKTVARRH